MRKIHLPIEEGELLSLKAFDQVLLSGKLYVGRDQVHSRLFDLLERSWSFPLPCRGRPSTTWALLLRPPASL